MATSKRKTVKSNPLDTISSVSKVDSLDRVVPIDEKAAKVARAPAKKRVASVKTGSKTLGQIQAKTVRVKSSASAESASENEVKKASTDALDSSSAKEDPPVQTAEDVLMNEFSPSTAMVVVPSSLFKEDHLSDIHALHIVKSWSQWAVVAGLIPAPLVDTVAISGVQIKMIHDLCKLYNVEFKKEVAVAVVSGLVGGSLTTSLAGMSGSILSSIPVIGSLMKYTAQPALSYASTYAIGRVFMRHFETDGTMLDLNSKKLEAYFKEQYAKGRKMFKYEFKSSSKAQSA